MFLRCKVRRKDGKQHRYWSVVDNTRVAGGRVVQRHVLYLGEIDDSQELAWRRSIEVLEDGAARPRMLSLFPEDRCAGVLADASVVHVKLSQLQLRRPRQRIPRRHRGPRQQMIEHAVEYVGGNRGLAVEGLATAPLADQRRGRGTAVIRQRRQWGRLDSAGPIRRRLARGLRSTDGRRARCDGRQRPTLQRADRWSGLVVNG